MVNVISEVPTPSVERIDESERRLELVKVPLNRQKIEAKAFGSPSEARRLGAAAVDRHDEALRRLADA
jgi:hypothetical protein